MKLIFFGTSGGIQTKTNANVCFLVADGKLSVLIDVSGNPVQYLERAGVDPLALDALVLTHSHTDRMYALPSLIHNLWLMKRKKPLSIVSNLFTIEKAKELCACFSLLSKENLFPISWIENVADRIELFPVAHSTPTSGVRITASRSRLVYSADTSPCEAVVRAAKGAKALIHEASNTSEFEARLNSAGHSSGRQAGVAAKEAGVEKLFLCHFDPQYTQNQDKIIRESKGAFAGEVIIPELFRAYAV